MSRCVISYKQKYKQADKTKFITLVTLSIEADGYPSVVGEILANVIIDNPLSNINEIAVLAINALTAKLDGVTILKPNSINVWEDYRYEIISFEGKLSIKIIEVSKPLKTLFEGGIISLMEKLISDNMWP